MKNCIRFIFVCPVFFITAFAFGQNTISLTSGAGSDAQVICSNGLGTINDITYSTTGATGTTFSGLPAGVTGIWAADNIIISGSTFEVGIFNYSITLLGGSGTGTATGTITIHLRPNAAFNVTPSEMTVDNPTCTVMDQSVGSIVSWEWSFGDGINSTNQNTSHTYENAGIFNLSLIISDANGCKDSAAQNVFIKSFYSIYIPSAFSPNGDGINDYFSPKGLNIDLDNFEMFIFNVRSAQIYHTKDITKPWNGHLNNSERISSITNDVYVYRILTRSLIDGAKYEYIGSVTIIK